MDGLLKFGDPASGLPVMRFSLVFEGDLPSSGNQPRPRDSWCIRNQLHPQLVLLWRAAALNRVVANRWLSTNEHTWPMWVPLHHLDPRFYKNLDEIDHAPAGSADHIDLCAAITRGGRTFFPLVRNTLGLTCSLKVLFLRNEPRGKIYQGGDLDGRIKTLFDALSIPQDNAASKDRTPIDKDPVYCLMEDDSLITGVEVRTEQLLKAPDKGTAHVHLLVEVDVRVVHVSACNTALLSD